MIENLDVTIELNMNDEKIFMWINDNECFYTDKDLKDCNVGEEIIYYPIKDIKRNMKLYKNYDLIKYLKNGASVEFEKEIITSLKENLNDNIMSMVKWGLKNIIYDVDELEMIKRQNKVNGLDKYINENGVII